MTPSMNLVGMILALASALVWGGGDFTGGYATRRASQYQVLALSAFSGLVVMIVAALVWRESFPSLRSAVWAMLAGASAALGIAALYRSLSLGQAASTAPTAGVISAALPVVYSGLTSGLPALSRLFGFGLAFAGIWLVAAAVSKKEGDSAQAFRLAWLAGIGFGAFFIFLGLVEPGKIFTPLIIARSLTLMTGLVLMRLNRLSMPALTGNPPALLAGILDAGGNLLYILAKQYTRVDTAAVLASFYPVSTVLLAALILKEEVTMRQRVGLVLCLGAIALITI